MVSENNYSNASSATKENYTRAACLADRSLESQCELVKTSQEMERTEEDSEYTESATFSAEEFVDALLKEGSKISCDESIEEFNRDGLPKFYEADKFKRAQEFFQRNVFALYFSKLLGLIVTLSSPSVLKILQMTKMSGCVLSSYQRYMATLLHMNIWYEEDLSSTSRSMQSIKRVKSMHNMASKKAKNFGFSPITQKDMVLTQFGFMGFAVSRTEMVGIHQASDEELKSFVHFWRVIGAIMGIQDRFNLCRESLEETKEICDVLISRILRPSFEKKDKDFLEMTLYLIEGMWHMVPLLQFRVFMTYLYEMLKDKNNNTSDTPMYFDLTTSEKWYLKFIYFVIFTLKYKLNRLYLNLQHNVALWIMDHYPFLAVMRFGYKNSMVSVK